MESKEKNIGMVHYRRYFVNGIFSPEIADASLMSNLLEKYDVILAYPTISYTETVEGLYLRTSGKEKDLKLLREVIKRRYPEYVEPYDKVMKSKKCSYYNMFVIGKKMLDIYCEWLFGILFEVERSLDLSDYTAREARVFGFMSERLLNVWVIRNNLRVKYMHVRNIEEEISSFKKNALKMHVRNIIR